MHVIFVWLVAIIGLATPSLAWEGPQVEYSADTRMETADAVMEGVVFHAPGKERRETKTGSEPMTMIIRQDKKVIWMLMPDANAYMEMGLGQSQDKSDFSDYTVETTQVGEEEINGILTTKNKVIMTKKDGNKLGGFWWTTKEDIPIKMDMISVEGTTKERIKTELTNLKIAKQDPKLFEIPADYMNMSMGMPNLKDLMQEREPIEEGRPGHPPADEPKEEEGFGLQKLFDLMR
jgi:outer membrane lipoprotein-sorting protein